MSDARRLLNFTIDRNNSRQEKGEIPIAMSLEAEPGIGKTSLVEQVAQERGMGFTKLNFAQMEEAGDLIGFPQVEYECQIAKKQKMADGTEKRVVLPGTTWMTAKQFEMMERTGLARQTGRTRMNYAKPAWVPEYNENGNICLLDDYTRATPQLLQAAMELIYTQKYVSWSLPKKTTIVITSNIDDGTSNVNGLDEAQHTRFMNYEVGFSLDSWMEWAEQVELDSRCINFVASYADELFKADEQGNRICNPRSFCMFSAMIGGIDDWEDGDNLKFINTIAKGCFKDDNNRFASMFTTFIHNKMHLLIQPKDMLLADWDKTKETMLKTVYDVSGQYRPDLAHLLERRFTNFVNHWLASDKETPIKKVEERVLDFLDMTEKENKKFFNKDLFYHMLKSITSQNKRQTQHLMMNPRILKIVNE